MVAEPPEGRTPPLIGRRDAKRLCIALIAAEQDGLRRDGRLTHAHTIGARLLDGTAADSDDLLIDEATLGFDSLLMLSLITVLTRFFGLATTGVEDYLLVRRRLGDWADLVAHHFGLVGAQAALTFTTSGSTGAGKAVAHSRRTLESEVAAIGSLFQSGAGEQPRILSMVAPHHIYGFLWSCLLPHHLGRDVCDLYGAAPTRLVREVRPGDLVLGTPFTWAQLAATGLALPDGVSGVTSGAPSTPETWRAGQGLGLVRMIDIYGSTETGGVGWREAEGGAFRLLGDLQFDAGELRRCGAVLDLQDRLEWRDARMFSVLGRRDTVVQVAGTNVCPETVRETLLSDPRVRDASIRLDGNRLKAFVVPEIGADPATLEPCLRDLLARCLPAPARPDRFTFGATLPRNSVGKPADW